MAWARPDAFVWDIDTDLPRFHAQSRNGWRPIGWSASGTTLAVLTSKGVELASLRPNESARLVPLSAPAVGVAFALSPDASVLLEVAEGDVRAFDLRNGKVLARTAAERNPGAIRVAWTPDSSVWVERANQTVTSYETASGKVLASAQGEGNPAGFALSPDGAQFVTSAPNHKMVTRDTRTGALLKEFAATNHYINEAAWSADGAWVAGSSGDGRLTIWNAQTGLVYRQLRAAVTDVGGLSFCPHGPRLAISSSVAVELRDTGSWGLAGIVAQSAAASLVSASPDGRSVLERDLNVLVIRNARTGTRRILPEPVDHDAWTGWSHDGTTLAVDCGRGIQLYDPDSGAARGLLEGVQGPAALSPDGKQIVARAGESLLVVGIGGNPRRTLGPARGIASLAWGASGRIAGASPGSLRVWNAATGAVELDWQTTFAVSELSWSPDGKRLAIRSAGVGSIAYWDAGAPEPVVAGSTAWWFGWKADGSSVGVELAKEGTVHGAFDFSSGKTTPEGSPLAGFPPDAVWGADRSSIIWEEARNLVRLRLGTGETPKAIHGRFRDQPIQRVFWPADSGLPVLVYADIARVWDPSSDRTGPVRQSCGRGDCVSPDGKAISGHDTVEMDSGAHHGDMHEEPTWIAWHPSGKQIAGAVGFYARVWDSETGKQVVKATRHESQDAIATVTWSRNGKTLWIGDEHGRVIPWDFATNKRTPEPNVGGFDPIFAPDAPVMAIRDVERLSVTLWKTEPMAREVTIKVGAPIVAHAISQDGTKVAVAEDSGRVTVFDRKGTRLWTGQGQPPQGPRALAFGPGGQVLAMVGGEVTLFRLADGAALHVELQAGGGGAVFVADAAGRFAGAPETFSARGFRMGGETVLDGTIVTAEQLRGWGLRAGLVKGFFAGEAPADLPGSGAGIPPLLEWVQPPSRLEGARTALVRVRATDRGGGVQGIQVLADGRNAKRMDSRAVGARAVESWFEVEVGNGPVLLEAAAVSSKGQVGAWPIDAWLR